MLLERWYHIELRKLAQPAELALNYVLYALALFLFLWIALFPLLRQLVPRREAAAKTSTLAEALTVWLVVAAPAAHFLVVFALAGRPAAGLGALGAVAAAGAVAVGTMRYRWLGTRLFAPLLFAGIAAWTLWPFLPSRGELRRGARGGRPDIVLILTDTLRADFLSCYGYARTTTPHVDSLAATGVRFARAYSSSSWTLPATATLLTGVFPSTHGAMSYGAAVGKKIPRLASLLQRAGYRTAAFTENQFVTPRYGFGEGFDRFWTYWFPWVSADTFLFRITTKLRLPRIEFVEKKEYPNELRAPEDLNWDALATADHAADWIEAAGDAPLFLYVHFMGPHGPYGVRENFLPGDPPAVRLADHPRNKGGGYPIGAPGDSLPADELSLLRHVYAADVRYVDEAVGRLVDATRRAGRSNDTIFVFLADHGEEFYDHEGWNHGGSTFEEIVRIPLVVSGKAIPAGRVIERPVRLVDVMPAVLEWAGVAPPAALPGRSLRAFFGEPAHDGEERSLASAIDSTEAPPVLVEGCVHHPPGFEIDAVVASPYKLIQLRHDRIVRPLLYDLARDPEERENLADSLVTVRDSLTRVLLEWKGAASLAAHAGQGTRLDPETEARLRALGYIQ